MKIAPEIGREVEGPLLDIDGKDGSYLRYDADIRCVICSQDRLERILEIGERGIEDIVHTVPHGINDCLWHDRVLRLYQVCFRLDGYLVGGYVAIGLKSGGAGNHHKQLIRLQGCL